MPGRDDRNRHAYQAGKEDGKPKFTSACTALEIYIVFEKALDCATECLWLSPFPSP